MTPPTESFASLTVPLSLVVEKERAWERERAGWERERELLVRLSDGQPKLGGDAVGVFWDYENCTPPLSTNPSELIKRLRTVLQPYGPISFIRCYQDVWEQHTNATKLRSGLEACGVEVRDCGRWGRKDVADHHIMADMLLFALDQPAPSTIVLISGDKDFSYLLSNLRNRKYNTMLVENPVGAAEELKSAANKVFRWKDILRRAGGLDLPIAAVPIPAALPPRRPRANSDPESLSGDSPAEKLRPNQAAFKASLPVPAPKTSFGASPSSGSTKPFSESDKQLRSAFKPLIDVLQGRQSDPMPLWLWCEVKPLVLRHTPRAFAMVHAQTWREYVEFAAESGIVTYGKGGKPGMEWISLIVRKMDPPVVRKADPPVETCAPAQTHAPSTLSTNPFSTSRPSSALTSSPQRPAQPRTLSSSTAGTFGASASTSVGASGSPTKASSHPKPALGAQGEVPPRGTASPAWLQTQDDNTHDYYQAITAMPEYLHVSLDELRLKDYEQNRKVPGAFGSWTFKSICLPPAKKPTLASGGNLSASSPSAPSPFASVKSPPAGDVFGSTATPPTTSFTFGTAPATKSASLFGAASTPPSGGNLFNLVPFASTSSGLFSVVPSASLPLATTSNGSVAAAEASPDRQKLKTSFSFSPIPSPPPPRASTPVPLVAASPAATPLPPSPSPFVFGKR